MAIKIVDLPIKNNDFPVRYVSLPEGNRILVGSASGDSWDFSDLTMNGFMKTRDLWWLNGIYIYIYNSVIYSLVI